VPILLDPNFTRIQLQYRGHPFGYYEAAGRDTGIISIVHNTGITSILPESSSICNTGTDTGKY
jgi:hypothetical protein